MNDDLDFEPPGLVRFAVIAEGLLFLVTVAYYGFQLFLQIYPWICDNLAKFLNGTGLIFQLIGLASLLPDYFGRKVTRNWEKKLNIFGKMIGVEKVTFTKVISTISIRLFYEAEGVVGFISHFSRILGFVTIIILASWFISIGKFNNPLFCLVFLLLMMQIWWVITEVLYLKFPQRNIQGFDALKGSRAVDMLFGLGFIFFLTLCMIIIPITYWIKWVSANRLKTVLIRLTYPGIVLGTVLQLLAVIVS